MYPDGLDSSLVRLTMGAKLAYGDRLAETRWNSLPAFQQGNVSYMSILGDSIVVAARHQVSCDLAGEVAILDIKSGIYYGLNAVGARIWNLIQEPKLASGVCETILEEHDVEADRCRRDILALLEELVAKGLVEVRNGTAP